MVSHVSHASLRGAAGTRLRRMRRFTGNPVCGTKPAFIGPDLSSDRASSLAAEGRLDPYLDRL